MKNLLQLRAADKEVVHWISVKERLPDSRRWVQAWGMAGFLLDLGYIPGRRSFLGQTKFNPSRDGGSFDIENRGRFSFCWVSVTHWAEQLQGPRGEA